MTTQRSTFTIKTMKSSENQTPAAQPATPQSPRKPRGLTVKQKLFVQHLIDNPKASATAAAKAAYNVTTNNTASQIASDNLTKPMIVSALASFNDLSESTIKRVMTDWNTSVKPRERELALQAAYFTHDKIHGKATQRVEATTTGVTLSIDLTGLSAVTDTPQQKPQ